MINFLSRWFPVFFLGRETTAILNLLRSMQMDIQQATAALQTLTATTEKIKTEVQSLIDLVAAGNAGQTTPEFDAALARLQEAVAGVDAMNPDAGPTGG